MADFLLEQSRLMLTGIIVSFISGFLYKIKPTGFKSLGKYRKKEEAVFIYLCATLGLGVLTPFIYVLSKLIIEFVPILTIVGFFIFNANFLINQKVSKWRHTTLNTLIIYGISIFIMILGFLIPF